MSNDTHWPETDGSSGQLSSQIRRRAIDAGTGRKTAHTEVEVNKLPGSRLATTRYPVIFRRFISEGILLCKLREPMPDAVPSAPRLRSRAAVVSRAVLLGIVIGMTAANAWPLLLLNLSVPFAVATETLFLGFYVYWVSGSGPPRQWRAYRAACFRVHALAPSEWAWGLIAAIGFALTIHSSIVLLFRFEPYPAATFHRGYDFSFISSRSLQWLACVFSAISAGVCEETGFRGYMQRPIERCIGPAPAIFISSLFFALIHLSKSWALLDMVPIIFGAGLLLGLLARASDSLIFCMIGHTVMDVGLFAYWWTQIAGVFGQNPLSQSGLDFAFLLECATFALFLSLTLFAIRKLGLSRIF